MILEDQLRILFPTAKRTTLKQMVQTGRVRLGGVALRRLSEELPEGAKVEVLARAPEPPRHRRGELDIIYEDDDLLVVNKPPGLLTATVPNEKRPTLLAKVAEYLERTSPRSRMGLIHRLDKDARGLLVFSKNPDAYHSLKEQLQARTMGREYHAVVVGAMPQASGRIESRLVEATDGKVSSTTDPRRGEPAATVYETVSVSSGEGGKFALLRVTLETGRKHQIRVHLSERSHPIVGDVMYGRFPHAKPPLLLAATKLTLLHPRERKPRVFELPVPPEFAACGGGKAAPAAG